MWDKIKTVLPRIIGVVAAGGGAQVGEGVTNGGDGTSIPIAAAFLAYAIVHRVLSVWLNPRDVAAPST